MNHRPQYKRPSFKDTVVTVDYGPQPTEMRLWDVTMGTGEITTIAATTRRNAVAIAARRYWHEGALPTRSVIDVGPLDTPVRTPAIPAWFIAKLAADKRAKAEIARKASLPIPPLHRVSFGYLATPFAAPGRCPLDIIDQLGLNNLPDNRPTDDDEHDEHDAIRELMGDVAIYDPTENFTFGDRSERLVNA